MDITNKLEDIIGNTPLFELTRLYPNRHSKILAKLEFMNPSSIKDRPVLSMIKAGVREGLITEDTEVVEASSGNTAIAIAMLGTIFGYKTKIFMSELCSVERHQILAAYGAEIVITPGIEHTKGARSRAIRYCEEHPDTTFFMNQHENPNNSLGHERTTGPEIWQQTDGQVDAVVVGLGTSGTFEGLARYFKTKNPNVKIIGFEPASSPVYAGGKQGKHQIIGIGPGFVTTNFRRSEQYLDELIEVPDDVVFDWTRKVALIEGMFVGPSSGAAAWVCDQLAQRPEFDGKTIVCLFCDTGERYLSTDGLFPTGIISYME